MSTPTATQVEEKKADAENKENPSVSKVTHVMGSYNITDVNAGGDITIISQHYETEFFTPVIDEYKPDQFVAPVKTGALVEMVCQDWFVILGGDSYDKVGLSRHMAWRIMDRLQCVLPIKEWSSKTNLQNIELHIQGVTTPTIFILPNISPQNVGYNLSGLYRAARERQHYLILSSNISLEGWKMENNVRLLSWQPAPDEVLYDPVDLQNFLVKELDNHRKSLPVALQETHFREAGVLFGSISLQRVAEELKTPDNIQIFIQLLGQIHTPVTEVIIQEILAQCQGDKRILRHWFYHLLTPRSQLIAIGLCLFEGCYDDQFFAAMNQLVENSWGRRDTSLQSLDFLDLESVGHFFRRNKLGDTDISRIESGLPEQRRKLLETIWETHRMTINSALPVLSELVVQSVQGGGDPMLFGTYPRRRLLRDVLGETFCHLGLKPVGSIEDTHLENVLLQLAATDNFCIQTVVARAISRWRFFGQDNKCFDTLQRWQEDKIQKMLNSIIEVRYTDSGKSPKIFIKVTVALAVGYAAQYDPPNQLQEQLCVLLGPLAKDSSNRYIRYAFANYTLPMVVRFHTAQIGAILRDMTREDYLREAIAISLAVAIQEEVKEAVDLVEEWYKQCESERPSQYSPEVTTPRDALMATVAYTYGYIRYDPVKDRENTNLLSSQKGFQRLGAILQKENHKVVRNAVITAVCWQISSQLDEVENHIKNLLYFITEAEKADWVKKLVDTHMEQRFNLSDGDYNFIWEEKPYVTWVDQKPVFTTIEKVMQKWLQEKNNKHATNMAHEFYIADRLVHFRHEEENQIKAEKERRGQKSAQDKKDNTVPLPPSAKPSFSIRVASWLVGFPNQTYREQIEDLLPIAMRENNRNEEKLKLALRTTNQYTDSDIEQISDKVIQALFILDNKNVLLPILAVMVIILLVLIF